MGWEELMVEKLMGLTISYLTTCESWNTKGNCQEWHNTTSKNKVERIALWNARWRILELLKTNICWATCLILSIAWWILNPREILKYNGRMKRILDEPPCRASMKNSGNEKMIKRKMNKWNQEFWWTSGIRSWIYSMK